MSRKTIKDIAHEAGVSITAVSFALNNRPGISDATRERILAIANRMDWVPNSRAQSLSLAKADAVGLFIARQPDSYTTERFFFNFIIGLQETLTTHNYDLVFHTGPDLKAEISTYRTWWAQGRVDGVVVVDPIPGDPRIETLNDIGMPAVVVGTETPHTASVTGDEAAIVTTLADHLYEQGARTIGFVTGIPDLIHTQERIRALEEYAARRGFTAIVASGTNATEEAGRKAIAELLAGKPNPTPSSSTTKSSPSADSTHSAKQAKKSAVTCSYAPAKIRHSAESSPPQSQSSTANHPYSGGRLQDCYSTCSAGKNHASKNSTPRQSSSGNRPNG